MKLNKISIGYISYFDMLPIEIVEYIFKIRDDDMVNLIIKNWYSYIGKKIVATQFLIKMCDTTNRHSSYTIHNIIGNHINNGINSNYLFNDFNIRRLKYINSMINGRENDWWRDIIQKIGVNCIYINLYKSVLENTTNNYNVFMDMISYMFHGGKIVLQSPSASHPI